MAAILIADDDQQIRELLSEILEISGYEPLVASNGNEAVRQYKDKRPDLVITDILMPEKDGIETIMELKRIDPRVKIIAISGGGIIGADPYLNLAKKLGAGAILEKPLILSELLIQVRAILAEP